MRRLNLSRVRRSLIKLICNLLAGKISGTRRGRCRLSDNVYYYSFGSRIFFMEIFFVYNACTIEQGASSKVHYF